MSFLMGFAIGLVLSSAPVILTSTMSTPTASTPAASTPLSSRLSLREVREAIIDMIPEELNWCLVAPHEYITRYQRPIHDMSVREVFHHGKACANGAFNTSSECARCFCAIVLFPVPGTINDYSEEELAVVIPGGKLQRWSVEEVLEGILVRRNYYRRVKMVTVALGLPAIGCFVVAYRDWQRNNRQE